MEDSNLPDSLNMECIQSVSADFLLYVNANNYVELVEDMKEALYLSRYIFFIHIQTFFHFGCCQWWAHRNAPPRYTWDVTSKCEIQACWLTTVSPLLKKLQKVEL